MTALKENMKAFCDISEKIFKIVVGFICFLLNFGMINKHIQDFHILNILITIIASAAIAWILLSKGRIKIIIDDISEKGIYYEETPQGELTNLSIFLKTIKRCLTYLFLIFIIIFIMSNSFLIA